ncbi:hypothetical protein ZWY2020_037135 [Hordeum vulgare]|nr:hypothetical protein ZWY2020_037135 [Hordeum vulgare]
MQDSRGKLYEEDIDVVIKPTEQNEVAARRTPDDTDANVSEHKENYVVLESLVLEETNYYVFAAFPVISYIFKSYHVNLFTDCEFGGKVADEDACAASILDGKPRGVSSTKNDNGSDSKDLPPEIFMPEGLDYGDALENVVVSSMEVVVSKDDDLILTFFPDSLTIEGLLSAQDSMSSNLENARNFLSSQDLLSVNTRICVRVRCPFCCTYDLWCGGRVPL